MNLTKKGRGEEIGCFKEQDHGLLVETVLIVGTEIYGNHPQLGADWLIGYFAGCPFCNAQTRYILDFELPELSEAEDACNHYKEIRQLDPRKLPIFVYKQMSAAPNAGLATTYPRDDSGWHGFIQGVACALRR